MSESRDALARPLWIIATVALLYAVTTASAVVVPLLLSILISLTLAPAVRALVAVRLPRTLAALVVVAGALTIAGSAFYLLAEPAQAWMERAPSALRRLEFGLSGVMEPIERASEATESLMKIGTDKAQTTVVTTEKSTAITMLSRAPAIIGSLLATVFLTFLFLMYGDMLLRKLVTLVPGLSAKKDLVAGTREAQHELSLYLLTVTLINIALGAATAGILYWLGVEDPLLWGGVAALLNYAPYVGAVITALLLTVVGFAEFAEPMQALAVPGGFIALNLIEGQVVTPLLLGRRLALDPVVIFVSIMLFGFLWGMTGMLMAVPLLACLRIMASRVPGGARLAQILGELSKADKDEPTPEPDPAPPSAP
ncbi:MAG TPA: AI-2E family transporter [Candidatus Saccharimonadia bacterium]|nr:AI-2E family transporter [Candidatus Saccharimonadia bacterium]